jgi:NAD(P)-dependent dehydrogenase (short-subunit alcohol dehydrogenase family)
MTLQGKIALVTGASRGIGRAIAERLARDGALVAIHYGSDEKAAATAVAAIEAAGGQAFALRADLASLREIEQAFAALDAELNRRTGLARFDILVNNAAISVRSVIEQTTEAEFDRVFAINVKGTFFVTQQAVARLNEGGRVVNISSGVTRRAYGDQPTYTMTKGAINAFTLSLAKHLSARRITVNTLAPGITDTDQNADWLTAETKQTIAGLTALGRVGAAADIADAVAFLASDDSRWVTNQYIDVSGGLRL